MLVLLFRDEKPWTFTTTAFETLLCIKVSNVVSKPNASCLYSIELELLNAD